MKAFFSGIAGAVIAGILLFIAQTWWAANQAASRQIVTFDKISDTPLTETDIAALLKQTNKYTSLSIQNFKTENKGSDDISNKSFSVASQNVLGFGVNTPPNGNPKNINISYDGNVLTVNYRLLPAKSSAEFWVASSASTIFPEFSNDNSGVHVLTDLEKLERSDPFPWALVGAFGGGLLSLIVGLLAALSAMSQQRRERNQVLDDQNAA